MVVNTPRTAVNAPPHPPAPVHVQGQRDHRATQRSSCAYDPTHGQGIRSNEGGKGSGRTRGAVNYRTREVEVLLDYAEAELPIGGKGWSTVGARFREWAAISGCSPRTDRLLEVKFKQVCPRCIPCIPPISNHCFHSSYAQGNPPGMPSAPLKLSVPMESTTKSRQKLHAVIWATTTSLISRTAMMICQTMSLRYPLRSLVQDQPLVSGRSVKNLLQVLNVNRRQEDSIFWTRSPNLSIPHTRPSVTPSEHQHCFNLNN